MYPSFVYNYVFIYLFIYFYTGPTLIAVFITEMIILVKPKTNFMDNLGKSIVVSGRVFFSIIMRARARPLFLRTVFQILFRIPPPTPPPQKKNRNKGNPRTDISALKSFLGFRVRLQIRNTVEVLLTDTLVTGKLYFRPPSQDAVQFSQIPYKLCIFTFP